VTFLVFQAVLRWAQLRRGHASGRPDPSVARRRCVKGSPARGWQKAGSAGDRCSHAPPRLVYVHTGRHRGPEQREPQSRVPVARRARSSCLESYARSARITSSVSDPGRSPAGTPGSLSRAGST